MPIFSKHAESVVQQLAKVRAYDRKSAVGLKNPQAAAPLVNVGVLEKRTVKPRGGSQTTVYWLTALGRAMNDGFAGERCKVCGCTVLNACAGPCHWVAPNLCSNPACIRKANYRGRRLGRHLVTPADWDALERAADKGYETFKAAITKKLKARK